MQVGKYWTLFNEADVLKQLRPSLKAAWTRYRPEPAVMIQGVAYFDIRQLLAFGRVMRRGGGRRQERIERGVLALLCPRGRRPLPIGTDWRFLVRLDVGRLLSVAIAEEAADAEARDVALAAGCEKCAARWEAKRRAAATQVKSLRGLVP